jgi:hypothetical protein
MWTFSRAILIGGSFQLYPTLLLETVCDPFCVRFTGQRVTETSATFAPLVIHAGIVSLFGIRSCRDCDRLTRPSGLAAGPARAGKASHDVAAEGIAIEEIG